MAAFIRRNDLSNGLIRPIRLSESTRLHSYPFKSNHAYMACKFAKETLVLCHSHISQIKIYLHLIRHAQVPSGIYKYSCYQYNSGYIFICVCPILSKTPIKLYSQKQLLQNNNYNSICIFICVCLVLSKTPIKFYLRI